MSKILKKEKSGYWVTTSDTTAVFVSETDSVKATGKADKVEVLKLKLREIHGKIKDKK